MPLQKTRPLTILDALLFVGMTAAGLALGKTIIGDAIMMPRSPMWVARPVTFFLLAWSLGFLAIRLKQPRPPVRRLMCQPGMAACCAVAAVTLVDATAWVIYTRNSVTSGRPQPLELFWRGNCHHPGLAVAAVWLALVLSRRWRAEPSWIDRFGRVIGFLWLLSVLCDWRFGRWAFSLTYRISVR